MLIFQDELRAEVRAQRESASAREHKEAQLLRAKLDEVQISGG